MSKRKPGAQEVPEPTAEQLTGQTSIFDDAPAAAEPVTFDPRSGQSIVYTATGNEFILPDELEAYRADNPTGAAMYEEEQAQRAAEQRATEIVRNLPVVQFAMDFLRSPEDALSKWNLMERYYPEWSRTHFELLVMKVAQKTGADPAQIANKDTRTEQQQRELVEAAAQEQMQRIDRFFDSSYMQAIKALEPVKGNYPDPTPTDPTTGEEISVKEQAVLYFFAKNKELRPDKPHELTEDNIAELTAIFYRLDSFYMQRTNGGADPEPDHLFFDFIEQDGAKPAPVPEIDLQLLGRDGTEETPSKIAQAESSGAIMTIGNRLFVPSDPEYQNAFITSVSAKIGLFKRDEGKVQRQLALDINTPFLQALAKAVFVDFLNGAQGETQVYFPTLARELGLDLNHKAAQMETEQGISRADARQIFINKLLVEIDNIWGKLPNDTTEYKLISVHAYNPDTEILYFISPYFQRLIGALVDKEAKQRKSGKHYYLWSCDLLHATAANERNPAAVEMATRLLVGVQQRGLKPDAKLKQNRGKAVKDDTTVTYSIKCAGLVQDCPQIRERLNEQPNTSRKTQVLKRTFTAMYRILREKTDLFTYYDRVTITEVVPTAKSLDAEIVITHHGGNPTYKRPFLPLKDEPIPQ